MSEGARPRGRLQQVAALISTSAGVPATPAPVKVVLDLGERTAAPSRMAAVHTATRAIRAGGAAHAILGLPGGAYETAPLYLTRDGGANVEPLRLEAGGDVTQLFQSAEPALYAIVDGAASVDFRRGLLAPAREGGVAIG